MPGQKIRAFESQGCEAVDPNDISNKRFGC